MSAKREKVTLMAVKLFSQNSNLRVYDQDTSSLQTDGRTTWLGNTAVRYDGNKKLSYCWETVRRESMPRIAEMDVEMTT